MAADRIVIDSGYLLEAILPSSRQGRRDAIHLMHLIADSQIAGCVPWVFFPECAAACLRSVRSADPAARLDAGVASDFLEQVDSLGLDVDLTLDGSGAIFDRAAAWGVQAYDSLYVELALRMDLPLAAVDKGVRTAAQGRRVALW